VNWKGAAVAFGAVMLGDALSGYLIKDGPDDTGPLKIIARAPGIGWDDAAHAATIVVALWGTQKLLGSRSVGRIHRFRRRRRRAA
jgi:hypothetical protein